jgi:hypothetical protein
MASRVRRTLLNIIPSISEGAGQWALQRFSGGLVGQLGDRLTDRFLEVLLYGMDLGFSLSKDYRRNIKDFRGSYVFRTANQRVAASATFANEDMQVQAGPVKDWDCRITFKDAAALRRFLFSGNQDILNSLLANEVEVEGNLNYIYRFGFLAKDLGRRLGVV